MDWAQAIIDKCFDDFNDGHNYLLSNRLVVFAWHYPKNEGRYGRRGFKQCELISE